MNSDHRLWPGKARPDEASQCQWHPATFHGLDVAACAERLLVSNQPWLSRLASTNDVSADSLRTLFVQLIAMHDIGKLSEKFCSDLNTSPPISTKGNIPSEHRHWQISYRLLFDDLDADMCALTRIANRGARRALYAAVAGHHGIPPSLGAPNNQDKIGVPAAKSFINDLTALFPAQESINLDTKMAHRLSWSLAGLTVAADWLGSNQTRFPYASHEMETEAYWQKAKRSAMEAVDAAGVSRCLPAPGKDSLGVLGISSPRPMQAEVSSLPLPQTPSLVIIEDTTGSGKTEAALILAHRMMQRGLGEGIYVALPTMATANAMYERLGDLYRKLFSDDGNPSIALAHGKRKHSDRFRDAVDFGRRQGLHKPVARNNESVAASCADWIADDRRKTFLGEVGVGTIDQAFLAVLPVKFFSLRLFGLSQRILVVDEAHACDHYMREELKRSLEMQASMRGSAIVMTATLTDELRGSLVQAYRKGLGNTDEVILGTDYPALTVASTSQDDCRLIPVEPLPELVRSVPVKRLQSSEAAVELLLQKAARGACCVWIRNTVDAVIEGAAALERSISERAQAEVTVEIFHARFTLHDRLHIEQHVVSSFGKRGDATARCGRILVASQVIEASLDLDFDVMVSDIAPIDSLIQRMGRLWRHVTLESPRDRRGVELELHVVSPDPDDTDTATWSSGERGGDAAIYGAPILWRTARALFDAGTIDTPEGLPTLLERVDGADAPEVPDSFETLEGDMYADRYAKASLANLNLITVSKGYKGASGLGDDTHFPTRASLPSRRIVLLKHKDEEDDVSYLSPGDVDGSMSEVSITQWRFDAIVKAAPNYDAETNQKIDMLTSAWPGWRKQECLTLIVNPDGAITKSARYDRETGLLFVPHEHGDDPL